MDLAIGAKQVFVMMTLFAKDGTPKLVARVHLPAHRGRLRRPASTPTSRSSSSGPTGSWSLETFGTSFDELADRLDVRLSRR